MSARVAAPAGPGPRRWLRLARARAGVELRLFWRERQAVLGTYGQPLLLLLMLGTIFGDQPGADAAVVTANILTMGVAGAAFIGLGLSVATDRDDGTLARLRQIPAPASVYLAGKTVLVLATSGSTAALLLAAGTVVFDLNLPGDPARWLTLGWVLPAGIAACALLGVAASRLAGTVRAAGAMMTLSFLALVFASGLLVPVGLLPAEIRVVGQLFPFAWLGHGIRAALLPEAYAVHEATGVWEHGRAALILSAWCIGGLVLCLTTFRWRGPRDG